MKMNTQMRIIAGLAKGRRLACVPDGEVRPTPERMRQALFNILGPQLPGAQVLDLFSGTGSLGLEALSRGANACTFVEIGFGALRALRQNIRELGFEAQSEVLARNVLELGQHLGELPDGIDLVFAAPPYALLEHRATALDLFGIFQAILVERCAEKVSLSLQHSPKSHVPEHFKELVRFDHRKFGNAELSRFQCSQEEDRR